MELKPKRIPVGAIFLGVVILGLGSVFVVWAYERDFGAMRQTIDSFMGWKATPPSKPLYEPPPQKTATADTPKNKLTLTQYGQLKDGIRYEEAVKIIGLEGKIDSDSSFGGNKMTTYIWKTPGAQITVVFMNNKLSSKFQYGLE
jgi:hypothetical protein